MIEPYYFNPWYPDGAISATLPCSCGCNDQNYLENSNGDLISDSNGSIIITS